MTYLSRQRRSIADRILEATGLVPEIRLEGIAMVDPEDALTDVRMPEAGSHGHLTLLLAEFLAAHPSIEHEKIVDQVVLLVAEYGNRWSQSTRQPGAERELTAAALDRLERLSLITWHGSTVVPRPAISRYATGTPILIGRNNAEPTTQPELF
jgi:uncharacterized protein (TIGR02678 family)